MKSFTKHAPNQVSASGQQWCHIHGGDPALASDTGSPQHKGQRQHGGREGWSRREEGAVLLSSHTVEHEALLSYRHLE